MAIASETPVPTPSGWVRAADLRPGDYLFQPRGGIQKVGTVQSYIPGECYEVQFNDGLSIVGDRHTRLALQDRIWRDHQQNWFKNQKSKFAKKKFRRPLKVMSLHEIYQEPLAFPCGKKKWALQTIEPLEYPQSTLPVPPYILGLWLGSVTPSGKHYVGDRDFQKMQKMVRRFGFNLTRTYTERAQFFFRPGVREAFTFSHTPIPDLIPQSYLEADVDSRKLLLEGFFDARYAKKHHRLRNTYAVYDSWREIRRFQQLVESLGYVSKLEKWKNMTSFSLTFKVKEENRAKNRRYITKIEKIAPKQCVHVAVDGEYVAGEGFLAVC